MRILTLIENTSATEKLMIEHGLSFYIEYGRYKFLFDTGASARFKTNADRMRVDLKGLYCAVLSHNHIDHAGGLDVLLELCPNIKIFMRKSAQAMTFKQIGLFKIPIGHPTEFYDKRADNIIAFNCFQEIVPGIFLMSDESGEKRHICKDKSLFIKKGTKVIRDDFKDEIFMVIFPTGEEKDGCIILSSCSHRGIINIIKTVQSSWMGVQILSVVGGFHLMGNSANKINCSDSYISELADELSLLNIGMIYTCHCTGQKGYALLKERLGDQIQYLQTGEELEF